MDSKKWIELGRSIAALRVEAAKKGMFDSTGFDYQLEVRR